MGGLVLVLVVAVVVIVVLAGTGRRHRSQRSISHGPPPDRGSRRSVAKPPSQWVTGHEPATAAQCAYLRHLGVDGTGMTKAQASIEIQRRGG